MSNSKRNTLCATAKGIRKYFHCGKINFVKPKHEALTEKDKKKLIAKLKKNANETDIVILTSLFTEIRIGERYVL